LQNIPACCVVFYVLSNNLSPDGSFRHTTIQFHLSYCKTLPSNLVKDGRSSVNLTSDQASKYFFPSAKADQVREAFRPSCRWHNKGHTALCWLFSWAIQNNKQGYGKNSKSCTCIL